MVELPDHAVIDSQYGESDGFECEDGWNEPEASDRPQDQRIGFAAPHFRGMQAAMQVEQLEDGQSQAHACEYAALDVLETRIRGAQFFLDSPTKEPVMRKILKLID